MRKKLLLTMLSVTMVAAMMTGCGKKNDSDKPNTDTTTVEQTTDTDSSTDAGSTDANTEDTTDNTTAKTDKNYTKDDIVKSIDPEHFGMSFEESDFQMTMATSGSDMYIKYGFFMPADFFESEAASDLEGYNFDLDKIKADGGIDLFTELYKVGDTIYCHSNVDGTDKYSKMTAKSEDVDSLFDDSVNSEDIGVNDDSIKDVKYIETIEYKGNTVDVVEVTSADTDTDTEVEEKITMYINVKDGMCVAMVVPEAGDDGSDVVVDIISDEIILPIEFDKATEISEDELMEQIMAVMFMPSLSIDSESTSVTEE